MKSSPTSQLELGLGRDSCPLVPWKALGRFLCFLRLAKLKKQEIRPRLMKKSINNWVSAQHLLNIVVSLVEYAYISRMFIRLLLFHWSRSVPLLPNWIQKDMESIYPFLRKWTNMSKNFDMQTTNVQTATLGMGWFWGPDARFGHLSGVIRTRVGFSGGTTPSPTYRNIGNHTETLEIDFDPTIISYEEILDIFWKNHNPLRVNDYKGRQYMSLLL
jgi:hypothetical protein